MFNYLKIVKHLLKYFEISLFLEIYNIIAIAEHFKFLRIFFFHVGYIKITGVRKMFEYRTHIF